MGLQKRTHPIVEALLILEPIDSEARVGAIVVALLVRLRDDGGGHLVGTAQVRVQRADFLVIDLEGVAGVLPDVLCVTVSLIEDVQRRRSYSLSLKGAHCPDCDTKPMPLETVASKISISGAARPT